MNSKRSSQMEMEGLTSLKSLVETYEEIAARQMQKVRTAVLTAREFLQGLAEIFGEVKSNSTQPQLGRGGKTVAVWISANAGLYGDIVSRSFELFADYLDKNPAEAVVVGRLGTKIMAERLPKTLYNYYDLEDNRVEVEDLGLVMRYLLQFQKIVVFYGQFKSLVNQVPIVTSVSGDELYEIKPEEQKRHQYLFEPGIAQVLEFFEGQMLTTMFEQTVHESQLAKFASRLMTLDGAVENIDKKVRQLNQMGVRLKHRTDGRKQLSRISGMSLWS